MLRPEHGDPTYPKDLGPASERPTDDEVRAWHLFSFAVTSFQDNGSPVAEEPGRDMRQRLSVLSGLELWYAISDPWIPDHHFRSENDFRRRFNKDMFKL